MVKRPIPTLHGLRTARLTFRRLTMADADWWMAYIRSDEAIRFMPFTKGSRPDCERMIQRSLDRYAADGSGLNALLLADGTPVGQCGLLTQDVEGILELEVGYHLLPDHWGRGYATEAANACKRHVFEHVLAPSLISLINPGNTRSQAVAIRNGMAREGRTIHRGIVADIWRTCAPVQRTTFAVTGGKWST